MERMTPETKLLNLIKEAQGKIRFKKDLKIFTRVNSLLIFLIFVVSAMFLVDLVTFKRRRPVLDMDLLIKDKQAELLTSPKYETMESFSYPVPEKNNERSMGHAVAENLSIVGIVAGDQKQVIIENIESKEKYFLYKGDSFEGFREIGRAHV